MKIPWAALLLAFALASPALADRGEDDLAAVKKAVATSPAPAKARVAAEDPAPDVRPSERKGEPKWFRVRIIEKAGKRAKVSVNLPLALVRAVGEDWTIHDCRRCDRRNLTFGEVLRSLDAGQNLVEIDDEESTVRVWVE